MRPLAVIGLILVLLVPLSSLQSLAAPPEGNDPPAGLGPSDPWIDAVGDTMFGPLTMGSHPIVFENGVLDGSAAGGSGLRFGNATFCTSLEPDCRGPKGDTGDVGPIGPEGPQGIQGETGPAGPEGPAGPAGANALASVVTEPAGANCVEGGHRVDFGQDANGNGTLDAGEVLTFGYVCDGLTGPEGPQGIQGETGPVGPEGPAGPPGAGVGRPGFVRSVIDSAGNVGSHTSLTIGADGFGLLTYLDEGNGHLKVAHCDDVACTSATAAVLDSSGGRYSSVIIGADGLGLISYWTPTTSDLKVAHCEDPACTSVTHSSLDTSGSVGLYSSATLGSDGLALISYHDNTNGDLKVAHCSNTACSSTTLATLDSAGNVGHDTSATLGSDGLGLISYRDVTNGDLKVAHCSNSVCSSATTTTLDSAGNVGEFTSVAIGSDGLGLISYRDGTNADLKVAHCEDLACTTATMTTLDATGDVGRMISLAFGGDGLGLVSYYDATNQDLKVAHCSDVACTSATISTVDAEGNVGQHTSIAIAADGFGLVSYYDPTNGDLKVTHLSNRFGIPYHRAGSHAAAGQQGPQGIQGETGATGPEGPQGIQGETGPAGPEGPAGPAGINVLASVIAEPAGANCAEGGHRVDFGQDANGDGTLDAGEVLTFAYVCDGLTGPQGPQGEPGLVNDVDCSPGGFIRTVLSGTATCAADQDTTYAAGTGLALTGSTFSIPTGGVTSAMIQDGTVAVADLAFDPATQVELDAFIGWPIPAPVVLDSAGDVGWYTSVAIGSDGLGLISYWDAVNLDLKVAHCSNTACSAATTTTTLDSAGDVGRHTSVTIGSDGLGLISYRDFTNGDLKVAHCSNTVCSSATTTTIDFGGNVGWYTSVTIGSDGLGLISYWDAMNLDLKVAHCSNTACSSATLATLDSAGDVGYFTSVAIGSDGLGLISYRDATNGDLKVAHCSNTACSSATLATLDSSDAWETSVTIGTDGLGLISYYGATNSDLKVAHCSNTACSSATLATLDSAGNVGHDTSVTLGNDGLGLISYRDATNGDLKVAHCSNTACSSATLATLDSAGDVGYFTSVAIGSDGLGLISYRDNTNGDLKVAPGICSLCPPIIVTNSGKIGIGTNTPQHRLTVGTGGADTQAVVLRVLGDAGGAWKGSAAFGNTQATVIAGEAFGVATIGGHSASLNAWQNLAINPDGGNVGVGTKVPADRLHVWGDVRVGTGTTGCVKDADATVIAGTCSSDARLKKDVRAFERVLDDLLQVTPVYYKWRAAEFPERHFGTAETYGLIAQDVEKVLPEMVHEGADGYKMVDYSELPLLTLQGLKDLHDDVEDLREDNEELHEDNERLAEENEELRAGLDDLEARLALLEAAFWAQAGVRAGGPQP